MDLPQLLNSITFDVYQNLKLAIEIGKWPDGQKLSQAQRELCMQGVIAYEHKHLPAQQHTGYIAPEPHTACGDHEDHSPVETALKWVEHS